MDVDGCRWMWMVSGDGIRDGDGIREGYVCVCVRVCAREV